jgi:hypothetical protein
MSQRPEHRSPGLAAAAVRFPPPDTAAPLAYTARMRCNAAGVGNQRGAGAI